MYVVVTKKDTDIVDLIWLGETFDMTDGLLVIQNEDSLTTFEDFTTVTHNAYLFDGELTDDLDPSSHKFIDGQFVSI